MEVDLHYKNFAGYVDNDMLNRAYSKQGKTFSCENEARQYHQQKPNSYFYVLSDYKPKDVYADFRVDGNGKKKFLGVKIADGAKRHITGYLVQTC